MKEPAEFASFCNRSQAAADELKRSPLPDVETMARLLPSEPGAEQGAPSDDRIQCDGPRG